MINENDRFSAEFLLRLKALTGNTVFYEPKMFAGKDNKPFLGVTVFRNNALAAPVLNLDQIRAMYMKGESFEQLVDTAYQTIMNVPTLPFNCSKYSEAKPYLSVRLFNLYKAPKEYVGKQVEDLKILPCLAVPSDKLTPNGKKGEFGLVFITQAFLHPWKITIEQLVQDALENASIIMPAEVTTLADALESADNEFKKVFSITHEEMEKLRNGEYDMENPIDITNSIHDGGAVCVFYPGLLDKINEQYFHNNGFLLCATSIHEFYALSNLNGVSPEGWEDFLTGLRVDAGVENEGSFLSDHLYQYTKEQGFKSYDGSRPDGF